jgi:hypothetical protein
MLMMKTMLTGIFLTSEHPEITASFYEQVAALEIKKIGVEGQYTYWRTDGDDTQLAIHDASKFAEYTYPALSESNLTHLYFKIDDQKDFLSHLGQFHIIPVSIDDVVVTLVDPDGRKVMFGTA